MSKKRVSDQFWIPLPLLHAEVRNPSAQNDLHVLTLQETFIEIEGESPGCRLLRIVAQKWDLGGLGVEKLESVTGGRQA